MFARTDDGGETWDDATLIVPEVLDFSFPILTDTWYAARIETVCVCVSAADPASQVLPACAVCAARAGCRPRDLHRLREERLGDQRRDLGDRRDDGYRGAPERRRGPHVRRRQRDRSRALDTADRPDRVALVQGRADDRLCAEPRERRSVRLPSCAAALERRH